MPKCSCSVMIFLLATSLLVTTGVGALAKTEMVPIIIDGMATAQTAAVIDGVAYLPIALLGKVQGKSVNYDVAGKRLLIGDAGAQMKPILEVVMGAPQCRETVEGLGLPYRTSVAVPEKLQFYSCVILNNQNAASPKLAERLKRFVADGGGLVLTGSTPLRLDVKQADEYDMVFAGESDVNKHSELPSIVDWFGCGTILSIQFKSLFYGQWGGVPATIGIETSRPLGSSFGKGTVLLRYKGSEDYAMLMSPDEFCEIAAIWRSESPNTDSAHTGIAAFAHPYGKGCIYWQSVIHDPNYPGLAELFRAGIARVAPGARYTPSRVESRGNTETPQANAKDAGDLLGQARQILDGLRRGR